MPKAILVVDDRRIFERGIDFDVDDFVMHVRTSEEALAALAAYGSVWTDVWLDYDLSFARAMDTTEPVAQALATGRFGVKRIEIITDVMSRAARLCNIIGKGPGRPDVVVTNRGIRWNAANAWRESACGLPSAYSAAPPTARSVTDATVRRAVREDVPAMLTIFDEALATPSAVAFLEPVRSAAWFADHEDPRYPIWVAVEGDRTVGWLSVSPYENRHGYHATAEVRLYVANAVQRRGIGRALMARALAHAPEVGITAFVARMWQANEHSIAFFERCGFERRGVLPAVEGRGDEPRDVVYYGRTV